MNIFSSFFSGISATLHRGDAKNNVNGNGNINGKSGIDTTQVLRVLREKQPLIGILIESQYSSRDPELLGEKVKCILGHSTEVSHALCDMSLFEKYIDNNNKKIAEFDLIALKKYEDVVKLYLTIDINYTLTMSRMIKEKNLNKSVVNGQLRKSECLQKHNIIINNDLKKNLNINESSFNNDAMSLRDKKKIISEKISLNNWKNKVDSKSFNKSRSIRWLIWEYFGAINNPFLCLDSFTYIYRLNDFSPQFDVFVDHYMPLMAFTENHFAGKLKFLNFMKKEMIANFETMSQSDFAVKSIFKIPVLVTSPENQLICFNFFCDTFNQLKDRMSSSYKGSILLLLMQNYGVDNMFHSIMFRFVINNVPAKFSYKKLSDILVEQGIKDQNDITKVLFCINSSRVHFSVKAVETLFDLAFNNIILSRTAIYAISNIKKECFKEDEMNKSVSCFISRAFQFIILSDRIQKYQKKRYHVVDVIISIFKAKNPRLNFLIKMAANSMSKVAPDCEKKYFSSVPSILKTEKIFTKMLFELTHFPVQRFNIKGLLYDVNYFHVPLLSHANKMNHNNIISNNNSNDESHSKVNDNNNEEIINDNSEDNDNYYSIENKDNKINYNSNRRESNSKKINKNDNDNDDDNNKKNKKKKDGGGKETVEEGGFGNVYIRLVDEKEQRAFEKKMEGVYRKLRAGPERSDSTEIPNNFCECS